MMSDDKPKVLRLVPADEARRREAIVAQLKKTIEEVEAGHVHGFELLLKCTPGHPTATGDWLIRYSEDFTYVEIVGGIELLKASVLRRSAGGS